MKHKLKYVTAEILKRAATLFAVSALFLIPILYYWAVLDFVFIDRPGSWPDTPDRFWAIVLKSSPTSPTPEGPTKTNEATGTADTVTSPGTASGETGEIFILHQAEELAALGYEASDAEYLPDGSFALGKLPLPSLIGNAFSISDTTELRLSYSYPYESAPKQAVYSEVTVPRLLAEVYMGYIIVDAGGELAVLDSDGRELLRYPHGQFEPAYTRDLEGNPLFCRDITETVEYTADDGELKTEERQKREYFRISDGEMLPSDYRDDTDGRGLYFDYPAYYGVGDSAVRRLYRLETEVTEDKDGNVTAKDKLKWAYSVTGYYYDRAFPFVSGSAFAQQITGYRGFKDRPLEACYILNEDGTFSYRSLAEHFNKDGRYLIETARLPVSFGEESIGSFYFDHGYIRTRIVMIDWNNFYYSSGARNQKVYSDEDVLIDRNGERFEIPFGYELRAYSSGMLLLEKDGRFGYMDYTGAWIAQPIFTYAEPFYEGLAVVGKKDGSRAVISTDGHEVIPEGEFEYISHSSSGVIAAYGDGAWTLIRKMAKTAP